MRCRRNLSSTKSQPPSLQQRCGCCRNAVPSAQSSDSSLTTSWSSLVLVLDLSGLALLGAGGRLLCSSLLALLRGLGSVAVFSVGRSTGSLGRHGNVVLSGEAGVTLGTGRRLATRRRDVRSSGKLTQRPWRATRARRRPSANPAESRLAHGLVGFGFW